jgi:hypothetical protein
MQGAAFDILRVAGSKPRIRAVSRRRRPGNTGQVEQFEVFHITCDHRWWTTHPDAVGLLEGTP